MCFGVKDHLGLTRTQIQSFAGLGLPELFFYRLTVTFYPDRREFVVILRGAGREVEVRDPVPRQGPVSIYVDVHSVPVDILVLGESAVHHRVPRDVVAPVGVDIKF